MSLKTPCLRKTIMRPTDLKNLLTYCHLDSSLMLILLAFLTSQAENRIRVFKISEFRGVEYPHYGVLGDDTILPGRWLPQFRRKTLHPTSDTL
jgi:hypothetical protein